MVISILYPYHPLILEIIVMIMVSRKYSLQEFLQLKGFLMDIQVLNLI